jgi:hypothetical protein
VDLLPLNRVLRVEVLVVFQTYERVEAESNREQRQQQRKIVQHKEISAKIGTCQVNKKQAKYEEAKIFKF